MDLIDRQQAIDVIDKIFPADPMRNDYTQGITCGAALATEYIKQLPSVQPQPEEDCDTCKHGYFGDPWCDNCRMRYPSHYEREEHHGSD